MGDPPDAFPPSLSAAAIAAHARRPHMDALSPPRLPLLCLSCDYSLFEAHDPTDVLLCDPPAHSDFYDFVPSDGKFEAHEPTLVGDQTAYSDFYGFVPLDDTMDARNIYAPSLCFFMDEPTGDWGSDTLAPPAIMNRTKLELANNSHSPSCPPSASSMSPSPIEVVSIWYPFDKPISECDRSAPTDRALHPNLRASASLQPYQPSSFKKKRESNWKQHITRVHRDTVYRLDHCSPIIMSLPSEPPFGESRQRLAKHGWPKPTSRDYSPVEVKSDPVSLTDIRECWRILSDRYALEHATSHSSQLQELHGIFNMFWATEMSAAWLRDGLREEHHLSRQRTLVDARSNALDWVFSVFSMLLNIDMNSAAMALASHEFDDDLKNILSGWQQPQTTGGEGDELQVSPSTYWYNLAMVLGTVVSCLDSFISAMALSDGCLQGWHELGHARSVAKVDDLLQLHDGYAHEVPSKLIMSV